MASTTRIDTYITRPPHTKSETWTCPYDPIDHNKVLMSSYLDKKSTMGQWKKKWVVLRECQFSYYKDATEYKPRRVIPRIKILSYNVIPDGKRNHFAIYTNDKVLHFKCDDEKVYNDWITALELYFQDQDGQEALSAGVATMDVHDDADVDSEGEEIEEVPGSDEREQSPHIPVHSIKNKHKKKPSEMRISDNVVSGGGGVTADEFSSDMTEATPGLSPSLTHKPIVPMDTFTRLDTPKETEEHNKPEKPPKQAKPLTPKDTQNEEYIIEKGPLQVLKRKYNHQWKTYYLILTTHNLSFYKHDSPHSRPRKSFSIDEICDVIELQRDPSSAGATVAHDTWWYLLIITPLKRIRVRCNNEEEMMRWFSALKAICIRTRKRDNSL
ncbi:uncharacterized protein SPAPADRAFT_61272 [Spathaspora passalidarum NRRL Y-27907]|uniref:PH domain-containing protein n=1 Tax=Spathaspora passalidarum (strain NRRL Y-27907 / 11-Y1) TaxID=619300 RepID=G3APL7_SPAPN|nr:uncharacterized protein SPAPADRAFT_61272 [Spathaspora passalidarum NRRL Y-27907]EGW32188.1 hypothetical protein SPAPADRAFT_61272 [Spathaspora passalidarum NRRL Y-27907]